MPVALVLALLLWAAPAAAQHTDMDAADAATVMGQAERVPGLEAERDALKDEVAALKAQLARMERLAAMDADLLARQERIAAFADAERDAYKARYDELAKAKATAGFWARVRERASQGALFGSLAGTAVPGVGNLAGAAGGAILGGIAGALESVGAP